MKNKFKKGFSLIETIIALLIISISGTIIMSSQLKISRSVFASHALIKRIFLIKNMFVNISKLETVPSEEKRNIENPETMLNYSSQTFNKLNIDGLLKEKIIASWSTLLGMPSQEEMVSFRLRAPKVQETEQQENSAKQPAANRK